MTICTSVSKNNQFINKVQSIHIIGDHVSTSIANCRNIGYIITWKNILVLVPKKNTRDRQDYKLGSTVHSGKKLDVMTMCNEYII